MTQNVTQAADDSSRRLFSSWSSEMLSWQSQELRRGHDRLEAEPSVELLGTVLVVGADPEMLNVPGRRDRCLGQSRTATMATVRRQDVERADLDLVVAEIERGEGDWARVVIHGQHPRAEGESDLARLGEGLRGVLTGKVLLMPGGAQRLDDVVGHLGHGNLSCGWSRAFVVHPHQPRSPEAVSLEARAQRLSYERGVEVDSPMLKAGQGQIGESDQLLDAHAGVVVNPHNVEVEVARIAARPVDGPVLPGLDLIADELLPPPYPGQRTSHKF